MVAKVTEVAIAMRGRDGGAQKETIGKGDDGWCVCETVVWGWLKCKWIISKN